jgi:all-trans-8'-apo-beta-carotenal 15,15'-oxygenase
MRDYAPFLERALMAAPPEDSYTIERIDGELPSTVRGVFYLNGPGRFERGALRYTHWLDGDGLVCAVRFDARGAHVTHRYVGTRKLIEEEAAGRLLFRAFGTAFPGDRLNRGVALESPANVSVVPFAGSLLAFGEQGIPYALDPATLKTQGPFTFRGALTDVTPFSAHPKRDPATGQLFNFGVSFSATQPTLNVYAFAPDATLQWRRRLPLDYPRSVHDFAVTSKFIVFYLSPYLLDMSAVARDGRSVMDALSWRPELGSRVLIVSRESGEIVASAAVGGCFCLHTVNAFDEGSQVALDVIEYERPIYEEYRDLPRLFADVGPGRPVRLVIETSDGSVRERIPIAYTRAPDFPTTDPFLTARPYQEFWMLGISATGLPGRKFFDELVGANWSRPDRPEVHRLSEGHYFAGEPAVVRDASGEPTALVCPVCSPEQNRSSIAIFRPRDLSEPVAMLHLRHMLPPLFHSAFDPAPAAD